jgi:hypothetical protein
MAPHARHLWMGSLLLVTPVAIRSARETAEALPTAVLEGRPPGTGKVAGRSEQLTPLEILVQRGLLGGSVSTTSS